MRRISSSLTFVSKFIVPGVLIALLVGLSMLDLIRHFSSGKDLIVGPEILVAILAAFNFLFYGFVKEVSISGNNLYVSNYRQEIVIHASEIADVRWGWSTNPQRITIYLHHRSEFGSKIVFLAPLSIFGGWIRSPIVNELRELASENQACYSGTSS